MGGLLVRVFAATLVFFVTATLVFADGPKRLLLVGQGPDGHPAAAHEYVTGLKILHKCLEKVPNLDVKQVLADEPWREGPELLDKADGVVLYLAEGAKWLQNDRGRHEALKKLAARGGGIVALHWAIGTKDAKNIEGFVKLVGGCHGGPDRQYTVLQANATVADAKHPIATGIKNFGVRDEFYYKLKFVQPEGAVKPVLQVAIDGQVETVAWSWERPDGGRSFGFSGLHFHDNWRLVEYRRLVAQAALWTVQLPIPEGGLAVNVADKDFQLK
jgi:hypothetical protein